MTGFRALLRLATREIRRHPARSALVFLLVALMVGTSTAAATITRTVTHNDDDYQRAEFGSAIVRVGVSGHAFVDGSEAPTFHPIDHIALGETLEEFAGGPVHVVRHTDGLPIGRPDSLGFAGPYASYGVVNNVELTDIDLAEPALAGTFEMTNGVEPEAVSEIVLTQDLLDRRGLTIGDSVEVADARFTIVGAITSSVAPRRPLGVVTRAGLDRVSASFDEPGVEAVVNVRAYIESIGGVAVDNVDDLSRDLLVGLSNAAAEGAGVPRESVFVSIRNDRRHLAGTAAIAPDERPEQLATLIAVVLGIQVALVAASAFAVGVRRRTRDFGQLLATGADHGHLRTLVLFEAAVLGAGGAVAGVVAGLGTTWWLQSQDWLSGFGGSRNAIDLRWHVIDWLGPLVVGVAASVAAAWWPTKRLRSLPAATALNDRLPPIPVTLRSTTAGLAALGIGTLALLGLTGSELAMGGSGFFGPLLMLVAVLAMFFGALAVIGNIIAWVASHADLLPVRARLVVRNSDRHQARAWMAVAAFVATMVAPIVIASSVEAYPDSYETGDTSAERWVSINTGPRVAMGVSYGGFSNGIDGPLFVPPPHFERTPEQDELRRFHAAFGSGMTEIDGVRQSVSWNTIDVGVTVIGPGQGGGGFASGGLTVALAGPEVAAALGIDPEDIAEMRPGSALVVGRNIDRYVRGAETLIVGPSSSVNDTDLVELTIERVEGAGLLRGSRWNQWIVLHPSLSDELGVEVQPGGLAYELETIPDDATLARIDGIANHAWTSAWGQWAGPGYPQAVPGAVPMAQPVEPGTAPFVPSLLAGPESFQSIPADTFRWMAIAITAAIAVIISLVTAALAAVELDREIGSMIATGASPSIRRWLLGAQTTYHLGLAAVIGVPLAVLLFWAATSADNFGPGGPVFPWASMAIMGLALPVVVGLAVAVLFRNGRPAISRRLS